MDNLKSRPVIINLEHVETEQARKMFPDFISGATYALQWKCSESDLTYLYLPANVDIAAKG